MSAGRVFAALAAAAAVYAFAVFALTQSDIYRKELPKRDELAYIPNERLLSHFTGGLGSIVADLLWVECTTYVGKQIKDERDFQWLNRLVNAVVALDPHFVGAYRFGGMFLAALRADDNASLDLLNRGIVANPEAWELPYEAAMVHLLNRRDNPDSPRAAGIYLSMSAATGNAPEHVRLYAQKLHGEHDLLDFEEDMWKQILANPNTLLHDMAKRKLQEAGLRRLCRDVNALAAQMESQAGRRPASLQELVQSGALAEIPRDPLGGRFFFDGYGKLQSTTLLDAEKEQNAGNIRGGIDRYREKHNAWPPNLDALLTDGHMLRIPPNPYPGETWHYDPATGALR